MQPPAVVAVTLGVALALAALAAAVAVELVYQRDKKVIDAYVSEVEAFLGKEPV